MDDDRRRQLADRVVQAQGLAADVESCPLPKSTLRNWLDSYADDVGELLAAPPPPHARMTADDALRNLAAERLRMLQQCQRERDDVTEYAAQLERQLAAEAT